MKKNHPTHLRMNQQVDYVNNMMKHIHHIIPPEKMHLYNILMGTHILGSYTNKKDMDDAVQNQFEHICCLKYYPIHYLCIKIQACWRGHKSRRETRALMDWWHQEWEYRQENNSTISS